MVGFGFLFWFSLCGYVEVFSCSFLSFLLGFCRYFRELGLGRGERGRWLIVSSFGGEWGRFVLMVVFFCIVC